MGITGTYKYDKKTGKMVKISDCIPKVSVLDCFVPKGGYWSENLADSGRVFIDSRAEKRKLLRKQGLREKEQGE